MDPWSSNHWLQPPPARSPPSSTSLPLDLDLRPTYHPHPTLDSHPTKWPDSDLSLPNWDNPSPPRSSNSPDLQHPSLQRPSGDEPSDQAPQIRSQAALALQTLNIDSIDRSPTNSDKTVFKSPISTGSDQQSAESNPSPPHPHQASIPSHPSFDSEPEPVNPSILPSSPAIDLAHRTRPEPVLDDDRWASFAEISIAPISSAIPSLDHHLSFPSPSSALQSGWDDEPNLGGWNPDPTLENPFSTQADSISIPEPHEDELDEDQIRKGWSSPHLSDTNDLNDDSSSVLGWGNPRPTDSSDQAHSSTSLGQRQSAARQWAQDEFPVQDEQFLPPCKPPLDLHSALSPGGELADTLADLSQDPLPETSATRTQLLFQNSATAEAFQTAMSKTASVASTVLKSAPRSRRLFPNTGTNSVTSQLSSMDPANLEESIKSPNDKVLWADLSALEIPHHPHDSASDVFSTFDSEKAAQKQQQQEQKKRSSFFGLWTSKSPPPTNTPGSLLTKKIDGAPSSLPPIGVNPIEQSGPPSSSSQSPSSTWPAPSPASANSTSEPAPSTIARLFGRLASRPTTQATPSPSQEDDQADATAPSTDLDARDIKFLESTNTVPIKPSIQPYDFSTQKNQFQSIFAAQDNSLKQQEELFDWLPSDDHRRGASSSISPKNPTSRGKSLSSKHVDHFGFLDSLSSDVRYHKSVSSDSTTSIQMVKSNSTTSIRMVKSNSTTDDKTTTKDDLDELFSHFESSKKSSKAPIQARSSVDSSNKNLPSGSAAPSSRPLLTNLSSQPGVTQVRMSSKSPTPILLQGARPLSSSGSTVKIPILAPPPPSRTHSSSPVPLIPPPGTSTNSSLHTVKPHLNQVRPDQSVNKNNHPSSSPTHRSNPPQNYPTRTPNGIQPALNPSTQIGGLSKEDLSFFDSLL